MTFGSLTNSGTLTADYLLLVGDNTINNSGSFISTNSLEVDGDDNGVTFVPAVLSNTGSLVTDGSLTIGSYGAVNSTGVGAVASLLGAVTITEGSSLVSAPPTYLKASNGGSVNVGSALNPTLTFNNGFINSYTHNVRAAAWTAAREDRFRPTESEARWSSTRTRS